MNDKIADKNAAATAEADLSIPEQLKRKTNEVAPKEGDKVADVKFVQTPEDVCETEVAKN